MLARQAPAKLGPRFRWTVATDVAAAEFIGFFPELFRRMGADEAILAADETIFRFWRRCAETP
jgi:hypothetical protein